MEKFIWNLFKDTLIIENLNNTDQIICGPEIIIKLLLG